MTSRRCAIRTTTVGSAIQRMLRAKSDHNPNSAGVVQAQDITHDPRGGFDSYQFAEYLRTHPDKRIKYVISNKKIFARQCGTMSPWKWRPYTGINPHDQHVHVSVADDAALYDDASEWDIGIGAFVPDATAPKKSLPVLRKGSKGFYVSMVQTCLGGSTVDGDFGPMTEQAVKQFQRDHELDDDGVVGAVYVARITAAMGGGGWAFSEPIKPPPVVILPPSDKTLNEQIYDIVGKSAIAKYPWKSRGVAPMAYTYRHGVGVFLAARAIKGRRISAAVEMAKADTHNDDKDALSWYRSNFAAKGMSNADSRCRHVATSVRAYARTWVCVNLAVITARDETSAPPTQRPTLLRLACSRCHGTLMLQADEISKLMDEYGDDEGCASSVHSPMASSAARRAGRTTAPARATTFRSLPSNAPALRSRHARWRLRMLRKHWGPINRKEVEIVTAANTMFNEVQRLVEGEVAVAA